MKQRKLLSIASFAILLVFLGAGCNPFAKEDTEPTPNAIVEDQIPDDTVYGDAQMAEDTALSNPATVYCLSQEGQFYMKKTMTGVTEGYCILPNGMECEVWAMYKGECGKVKKSESDSNASTTTEALDTNETATTTTTTTTTASTKPSATSTAQIQETDEPESKVTDDGKKKIEGEIDIAVRPGDESGEVIMSWDTHDFSAPEGYIVMLSTNSKLSYPTKFSHILPNESSYSFTWTGLSPEREYYFRVCIKKSDNCSTYSPIISTTLSEP